MNLSRFWWASLFLTAAFAVWSLVGLKESSTSWPTEAPFSLPADSSTSSAFENDASGETWKLRRPRRSRVAWKGNPDEVELLVDGKKSDTWELEPGRYHLLVKAKGYLPESQYFTLEPGAEVSLDWKLKSIPKPPTMPTVPPVPRRPATPPRYPSQPYRPPAQPRYQPPRPRVRPTPLRPPVRQPVTPVPQPLFTPIP